MISRTFGFDFDQTLADSKPGIVACLTEVCNHFALPIDNSRVEKLAVSGLTLDLMLSALFQTEHIALQRDKFMELYPSLGVNGTKLMMGARELLDELAQQGNRLVLISAKGPENLILSVDHLGLKFDEVYGGAGAKEKTRFIRESGACLYVGDQLSDVIAAKSANVLAVLVNAEPLSKESLAIPHVYFKNLIDLRSSIHGLIK